jgi:hypothetical protein
MAQQGERQTREERGYPTYEEYLMELLGMDKKELDDFLGRPSWGCLDMEVPPFPEAEEDLEEEALSQLTSQV